VFPSTEPKSVALWTGTCKAQQDALGIINEAYREVRQTVLQGDLSEYDGFTVLGHLNAAIAAMNVALLKAERELNQHKRDSAKLPAEPKPEPQPEPAPPAKPAATKKPEPKPEPPADEVIDEGDEEVADEPQPINEPVGPPPPPKPAKANGKTAKTPGHVEQLVEDIKTELVRFTDWSQYAAVFFDNKANDVDVLAGKVTDVRILSAILAALRKLPSPEAKGRGK
jgi:hypothetical protein